MLRNLKSLVQNIFFSRGAKTYLGFFSIAFVIYTVIKNFEKINKAPINNNLIICFAFAFFISLISLIINAIAWKALLNWLGYKQNNVNIIHLYLRTNLLKYLPGGIWHFFERYRVLSTSISPSKAFSSVLLEPFLMLSAALFLVPISGFDNIAYFLFFFPSILLARRWRGSLIMQLGAMKLLQFKKLGARLDLSQESLVAINPSSPYPLYSFLIELLFIILRFSAFWFCLKAFSIEESLSLFAWLSMFSISWAVGLVVPSAPGGVGVFESCALLIGRGVPQDSMVLALLFYRLIVSSADLALHLLISIGKDNFRNLFKA